MTEKEGTLPPKKEFSKWYNDILKIAEIVDVRYPVKGLCVWQPFGFSIRKKVYAILSELLDKDHQETQFPMLIPRNEFMKEAEHIKGFDEEVYWVTHGGKTELDVNLALRPTSETAIYPMYKIWIRSFADLPLKLYQIVNTFRYETKHTRPLIRVREITSFKEAHTVHATYKDAQHQVEYAIELYKEFYRAIAIPVLASKRPDWDKFPGADYTLAIDVLMPDGKALQVGTAHHLSDKFAKTFDITYEDEEGVQQYAHQTCYGVSERSIASIISIHGDDKGLVLPPIVAPVQVVIIPIIFKDGTKVMDACMNVKNLLEAQNIRVKIDLSDSRPGAKYYKWERIGVPIRIEIGPRDIKNSVATIVLRDTGIKEQIPLDDIANQIENKLDIIHKNLFEKAEIELKRNIFECNTLDEIKDKVLYGIVEVPWCGDKACSMVIEEKMDIKTLGTPIDVIEIKQGTKCPICEKDAIAKEYMARTY
ncbi:MAG: proline--tRNA ligase [Methanosarcinaceae archaeon]|nr:proline--tRNA ligase [Methanosarcinaceae archaeon]NKQ39280.1 proline--tRNA ligase [Methanosarcinales archaeon]